MKLAHAIIALSAVVSSASFAAAKAPNCEVKGKKVHVKDEAACTKKKGTWSTDAAAGAPAGGAKTEAPAAAPAAAAPAAAAPAGEAAPAGK